MSSTVLFLRRVALLEAVSYLLLLGIAMPLKYWADLPIAVRVMGSIHGGLFVVFLCALARVRVQDRWSSAQCAVVFVASLLPVVPFVLDRHLQKWGSRDAR